MRRNLFTCFALVIFILLFSTLELLQAEDDEKLGEILQDRLMIGNTCTKPPCLFGQSLQGMSYDRVDRTINASEMRDSLTLVGAGRQEIVWIWSPDIAARLNVATYSELLTEDEYTFIHDFQQYAGIGFRDGVAVRVWLYFETQLSTLVETYGEPVLVNPRTYTRFGDMIFGIFFSDVEGYFTAITRCDHPELIASTRIKGYTSSVHEIYLSNALHWQGYTDDLPDCTIFQP